MTLGTRTELARHWKIDARNSVLKKIKPVAFQTAGGKTRPLFAIDDSLTPVLVLDFERVKRATPMQQIALKRQLSTIHGENWFEQVEKLLN